MIELLLAQLLNFDNSFNEKLGALCEANNRPACALLVTLTQGQCAGPQGSGCAYDSAVTVKQTVDNGLMVSVPNVGYSRVESVNYCLKGSGVGKYQDLLTDSQFEGFEGCLIDLT
jgi:hypothetical protein